MNLLTGELFILNPEFTFRKTVSICLDDDSSIISATDKVDGNRWFKIYENGNETWLTSTVDVPIKQLGKYVEAYNIIEHAWKMFECSSTKLFKLKIYTATTIMKIVAIEKGD